MTWASKGLDVEELENLPIFYATTRLNMLLLEDNENVRKQIQLLALDTIQELSCAQDVRQYWDVPVTGLRRLFALSETETFSAIFKDTTQNLVDLELLKIIGDHLAADIRLVEPRYSSQYRRLERSWRLVFLDRRDTAHRGCSPPQLLQEIYPNRLIELRGQAECWNRVETFPVFRAYARKIIVLASKMETKRRPEFPMVMYFLARSCFEARADALQEVVEQKGA